MKIIKNLLLLQVVPFIWIVLVTVYPASGAASDDPTVRQDWVIEIVSDDLVIARPDTDKAVMDDSTGSVSLVASDGKLPAIKVSAIEIPPNAQGAASQRIRQKTAWEPEPEWTEGKWTILPSSDGVVGLGKTHLLAREPWPIS